MKLQEVISLGIAGNFAHHLEQAGELEEFKDVATDEKGAPKGIFPFYLPNHDSFLGTYPIGEGKLNLPNFKADVHMEPEIAILFDLTYDNKNKIQDIKAIKFIAFNDATIRKEGANKISEKKSWGANSKGIGENWIEIDKFESGGIMDNYRLCSFVKRDGILHPYGIDAPLLGYSYFYEKLQRWIIDKLNNQVDFGPLENISKHLQSCAYPRQALVSIGATAYTEFGENNYLANGDELQVIAYNKNLDTPNTNKSSTKSILVQQVSAS